MINENTQNLVYVGSLDDSVKRHPWQGIPQPSFKEIIFRHVIIGEPVAINDGYIFQSEWAINDIMHGSESVLRRLVEAKFLKVLCRADNFEDMPEKMEGDVATHSALKMRGDYLDIQSAALDFGKSLLDNNAYVNWPDVDIGMGFYRLCGAAKDAIRGRVTRKELEEHESINAMMQSALRDLIERFENTPKSIRGTLESEVIPCVIKSYKCRPAIARTFTKTLMGLANEIYHINFAALMSSAELAKHNAVGMAVETRSSWRFRELLDIGTVPDEFYAEEHIAPISVHIPDDFESIPLGGILDFVEQGKSAAETKQNFLDTEKRIFHGDKQALQERYKCISELNAAIDLTLFGEKDRRTAQGVNRTLVVTSTLVELGAAIAGPMLGFLNPQSDIPPDLPPDNTFQQLLASLKPEVPNIVRKLAYETRTRSVSVSSSASAQGSLINLPLLPNRCEDYYSSIVQVQEQFGRRSLNDD